MPSITRNGYGAVANSVGDLLANIDTPRSIRVYIPGNDIKRISSVHAGYIPDQNDVATGIMLSGLLLIVEGKVDPDADIDPSIPIEIQLKNPAPGLQGAKLLYAMPVSGVTPLTCTFSHLRGVESADTDGVTVLLTFAYRSDDTPNNASECNAFLNVFGVIDVAGLRQDFTHQWEIK